MMDVHRYIHKIIFHFDGIPNVNERNIEQMKASVFIPWFIPTSTSVDLSANLKFNLTKICVDINPLQ